MKGVSLLVALATLGVDIGWNAGPGGNVLYTIRIERVLLGPMRAGQPVVSGVDVQDRGLRRFQIVMEDPPQGGQATTNDLRAANGTGLQYGWRPAEEGGLEYLIQITPERLETLAKGAPIVGEVLPEVPEVRRFHISVGVAELPRVGLSNPISNPTSSENQPPSFLNFGDTKQARNDSPFNADSRFTIPPTDHQGGSFSRSQFDARSNGQLNNSPARDVANDGAWRNGTSNPSAPGHHLQQHNERTQLVSNTEDPRSQQYGQYGNGSSQQPPPDNRFADARYSQRPPTPPLTGPQNSNSPEPANYPPQTANTASSQPAAAQPPAQQPNWQTTSPNVQPPVTTPPWQPPLSQNVEKEADTPPWMPLILTTFALFASIGANAYIGWLAWSFFWRYRQAADDLERTRSMAAVHRQAA